MADLGVMRVVVAEDQRADVSDVNVVGLAVAKAVECKLGELNRDGARERSVRENALIVVMEVAVAHGQVVALLANAHAVLVNDVRAAEFDVLNCRIGAGNDPDTFALRTLPARVNMSSPAANA